MKKRKRNVQRKTKHTHRKKISMRTGILLFFALIIIIIFAIVYKTKSFQAKATGDKPNIVVIMTDDQRKDEMWVLEKTNSLIGAQGVTFSNFNVSNPQCCPSRATLFTGQYSHNNNVESNQKKTGYNKFVDSNTISVWLQNAGYRTSLIGKYLNGYPDLSTYIPPGWNDWQVLNHKEQYMKNYSINDNGTTVAYGDADSDYKTDVIAQRAVSQINEFVAQGNEPFFMVITPTAPHDGPDGRSPTRYKNEFKDLQFNPGPSFNEADVSDKPVWIQALAPDIIPNNIRNRMRSRARMLKAFDDLVESVVNSLSSNNILDNTVVIMYSDNGYFNGEHRVDSGKHLLYEEAVSLPFLVRGPGFPVGQTTDVLSVNPDITATIMALSGATPGLNQDGVNMLELINNPQNYQGRVILLQNGKVDSSGKQKAVKTATGWVYNEWDSGEKELYNLNTDPLELTSLHADPAYDATKAELASFLNILKTCAGSACTVSLPTPTP